MGETSVLEEELFMHRPPPVAPPTYFPVLKTVTPPVVEYRNIVQILKQCQWTSLASIWVLKWYLFRIGIKFIVI